MGYLLSPHSPRIWCKSLWHIPQYLMATFTSLGPRARRSISNLARTPLSSWAAMARLLLGAADGMIFGGWWLVLLQALKYEEAEEGISMREWC